MAAVYPATPGISIGNLSLGATSRWPPLGMPPPQPQAQVTVTLDTNVLLEVFQQRHPHFPESARVVCPLPGLVPCTMQGMGSVGAVLRNS
jgi:hypothetical protein